MTLKFIQTIYFIFFLNLLFGQDLPRWCELDVSNNEKVSFYFSSAIEKNDILSGAILDKVKNLHFSKFEFYENDAFPECDLNNSLMGGRGKIDNSEVLFIDKNVDNIISKNEIFILPELELDIKEEYNELYSYRTSFYLDIDFAYDYVYDSQIYSVPINLSISVYSKFDSLTNSLFYKDNFKVGLRSKLFTNHFMKDTTLSLIMSDYLPEEGYIDFTLYNQGIQFDYSLKEKFKMRSKNSFYSIDSLDIINKRILVSTHNSVVPYIISGPSLLEGHIISNVHVQSDYKIIQFWGSWCAPCIKNFPKLVDLNDAYPNIEILGVNIDDDKIAPIKIVRDNKITWKNIFIQNEEDLEGKGVNIWSFPTYLLLDRNNYLIGKFNEVDELKKLLEVIIK